MARRRKCPKGVFCIDNNTITFIIIILIMIGAAIFYMNYDNKKPTVFNFNVNQKEKHIGLINDPLVPPLKDGNYFPMGETTRGLPINIPTRGPPVPFRQLGILTRTNGDETILPLMGRPLYSNRSKWKYYTMTDKNNSVKVPISKNGRSCTQEYGCDELMNGDILYVEGYEDTFKATIYDNEHFNYIPYL